MTTTPTVSSSTIVTRPVEHEFGRTEVPLAPERVVSIIGRGDVEAMVALGLIPVATVGFDTSPEPFPEPMRQLVDGIELLPYATGADLNLEDIAALRPDLIVGLDVYFEEGLWARLAEIAPALPIAYDNGEWASELRRLGEVFDRSAAAEEAIGRYEAAVTEFKDRWADDVGAFSVAIIQPGPGEYYPYPLGEGLVLGGVLAEVGGRVPAAIADSPPQGDTRSLERLDDLTEADVIVSIQFQEEVDAGTIAGFESNPLWTSLPAVAAGRVIPADGMASNQGSVYARLACLDILDRAYRAATPD